MSILLIVFSFLIYEARRWSAHELNGGWYHGKPEHHTSSVNTVFQSLAVTERRTGSRPLIINQSVKTVWQLANAMLSC